MRIGQKAWHRLVYYIFGKKQTSYSQEAENAIDNEKQYKSEQKYCIYNVQKTLTSFLLNGFNQKINFVIDHTARSKFKVEMGEGTSTKYH